MKNIPVRQIKTTREQADHSAEFSIRDVQSLLAGKDIVQELHRHDYFYLLALKKGTGSHSIDFTTYQIRNHSIFFMRPGQVHYLNLKKGSTGYLLQFKAAFYFPNDKTSGQRLYKASHKNLCSLDEKHFTKLNAVLKYIFQEYTDRSQDYQDVIKSNISIFLIELLRHRQNSDSTSNIKPYVIERLEDFLALLETHVYKCKQVSEYADMLNLSVYQLNAITKEALGKTSSELITEHIILESKRQLLATSNQITQIAYHLGYDDVSYFIRLFKKHAGSSPEAFRHNNFK
jgi:AraC-like DNA-binding protein